MIASVANTAPTVRPSADDTAAKQRLDAAKQALAQQQVTSPALLTEEPAAVVSISKQGVDQATAQAAPAKAAAKASAAADTAPKSNKPALAYEAPDTDQDSKISAYEQQSYDFRHPALRAYKELAPVSEPKDATAPDSPAAITGKPTAAPDPV